MVVCLDVCIVVLLVGNMFSRMGGLTSAWMIVQIFLGRTYASLIRWVEGFFCCIGVWGVGWLVVFIEGVLVG